MAKLSSVVICAVSLVVLTGCGGSDKPASKAEIEKVKEVTGNSATASMPKTDDLKGKMQKPGGS